MEVDVSYIYTYIRDELIYINKVGSGALTKKRRRRKKLLGEKSDWKEKKKRSILYV